MLKVNGDLVLVPRNIYQKIIDSGSANREGVLMRKPVIVEGDLLAELMNRPPEELRSLFVHFFLQADQVESRESPFAERQVDRPS